MVEVVFVSMKQAWAETSQPRKQALETDNFNPHWRVGFFFSSSICEKSHSRREEMSLSFIPPQTKALNTQAVCFPRWFRGSCARVNYLPSNKREKCSLHWTAKLWPLGPICEIYVCRIRSLIFFKKAGVLTLLVFICVAQTNGTLSIKLLSRAS